MAAKKAALLGALRQEDIFALERGEIEDYYPEGVPSGSKPERAIKFCDLVRDRPTALARACAQSRETDGAQTTADEFEMIFGGIFGDLPN